MRGVGGLLDRYVLRRFVGAYGVCLFGFVLLFLVIDVFSQMDDFAKAKDAGHWRLEGKNYVVKDGDILNIRHC